MATATSSPLSFQLSDEHELLRSTVRDFAEQVVAPQAEELDRESRFPYDIVKGMADLGIMGITIPEEYGGGGSDTLSYAIAVEELARIDSSVSITMCAHHSLGTLPIYYFGSEQQKQDWLPALASGEKLHAFGLTEPGAGSDAGAARTTARRDGDEWVINGSKMFITNAGTDITFGVTVTAITGEDDRGRPQISTIMIPNGTPGYEISDPLKKMGWHASDTRALSFNDVRVPLEHLVGPEGKGFTQFLKILDGGRIGVASLGLGLAQGAYEQALKYAQERNQFGKPIAGFQSIAFMLADMAT
ncbi:MAG: acyl-CoA dehydrogenase domain protein, partial [Thermoleophilia bacterium]|nr:acyl-CoA dehydrogenase domain protein [Thermoleophilia bacterium]